MKPLLTITVVVILTLISCRPNDKPSTALPTAALAVKNNSLGSYYAFILNTKPDSVKSSFGVRYKIIKNNVYFRLKQPNRLGENTWVEIYSQGRSTGRLKLAEITGDHTYRVSEELDSISIEFPIDIQFSGQNVQSYKLKENHSNELVVSEINDTIRFSFDNIVNVSSVNREKDELFSEDIMNKAYRTQIDPLTRFGLDKKSVLISKWTNKEVKEIFLQVSTENKHYCFRISRGIDNNKIPQYAISY